MFHGSQSVQVLLHTSQDTRATHMHTHTPNRFDEAAEMSIPEQSDKKLAFSVVFGRCSTAFATKQIKFSWKYIRVVQPFNTLKAYCTIFSDMHFLICC